MSMNIRYKGGFRSVDNTAYSLEIYQQGYEGPVTEVAFGSSPLEIAWQETDKLEPVQSSAATLTLFSDTDRQFIDLYTVEAGSIMLRVYRGKDELYWCGALDTELYEEPYSFKNGYEVTLTFSDLAILDRLNFDCTGYLTIRDILARGISRAGLPYDRDKIVEYISTGVTASEVGRLTQDISLVCDNFYDENQQPMTWREVVEETLRPFALRLIQKTGRIVIYDLNAIHAGLTPETIHWETDDAVLGTDKVYNNVKVTFSPYQHTSLLSADVEKDSVTSPLDFNPDYRGWAVKEDTQSTYDSFHILLSDKGRGMEKGTDSKYFRITPDYSSHEGSGVAYTVRTLTGSSYTSHLRTPSSQLGPMLLKAPAKVYLPYASYLGDDYKLRVSLEMLADVRYNPFEEKSKNNEEGNWDRLNRWCNFSYIPFRLILRDDAGNALYHYSNRQVKEGKTHHNGAAHWAQGEGTWGSAFLAWYDLDSRKDKTGLGGWQANKQCIGCFAGKLPSLFNKRGDGEYIELPPEAGWLELEIGSGLLVYNYDQDGNWNDSSAIYPMINWLLYKGLKLSIVDNTFKTPKEEDIEYNAWLNRSAAEELSIDTIAGTLKKQSPYALGQLFRFASRTIQNTFHRAGKDTRLEHLLISTAYSNYAKRNNTLSGTARLLPGFGIYTDVNDPSTEENEEKRYLLLSETQRLRENESEIKMVQFSADTYEGIEITDGKI